MPDNRITNMVQAPEDAIFGLNAKCRADPREDKINLGIGAYRTAEGKPYLLRVVSDAEKAIAAEELDREYLPIDGLREFRTLSAKLILGDAIVDEGRVATCQTLSGTGANRMAFDLIAATFSPKPVVYISDPTWGNHPAIIGKAGLEARKYRYFDAATRGIDWAGLMEDLGAAPDGSVVLLHSCAHNPTGVDPTDAQWSELAKLVAAKGLFAVFDSAYQGYATGDLERDRSAVKIFADAGLDFMACQSYSKNLGLYSERIGCLSCVTASPDAARAVESQMKLVARPSYSNPPSHGARIVTRILGSPELYERWTAELKQMSQRIIDMRAAVRSGLEKLGTPGTWHHVTDQIGMFSFTGLTAAQVAVLQSEHSIYMLPNGRISLAGLTPANVDRFVAAVDAVVRGS